MAATYNKFNCFVEDVLNGLHAFFDSAGDTLKVYLSNAAPSATADFVIGDCAEIGAGNGYTAGGEDILQECTRSGSTVTVTGNKIIWTAGPAAMNTFQYVVLYNPDSPSDSLVAWWDYLAGLALNAGETFTVKFNNGDPRGTVFTLA